jgi:hypothetical protein
MPGPLTNIKLIYELSSISGLRENRWPHDVIRLQWNIALWTEINTDIYLLKELATQYSN